MCLDETDPVQRDLRCALRRVTLTLSVIQAARVLLSVVAKVYVVKVICNGVDSRRTEGV